MIVYTLRLFHIHYVVLIYVTIFGMVQMIIKLCQITGMKDVMQNKLVAVKKLPRGWQSSH